ncbi:MAG: hypothetical protein Kow0069_39480 [Promethearchaeota archaeon]
MAGFFGDPVIDGYNGTYGDTFDGFGICFDNGATNFSTGYFTSGMRTAGGAVDLAVWRASSTAEGTEDLATPGGKAVAGTITDYEMTEAGMVADDSQDYVAAVSHGNITEHYEQHYSIEILRKLNTGDSKDVLLDGRIKFGVVIFNGTAGSSHIVSFVHKVIVGDLSAGGGSDIPGFPLAVVVGVGALAAILVVKKRRR